MAATEPAFAAITSTDRRGLLWIASILSLIFVLFTLSARLYVRKHMLGRDDFATVAAAVVAVGQYVTIFIGLSLGLGTSQPEIQRGQEDMILRAVVAAEILFLCTLYMAKFAVLLATERLLSLAMVTVRKICIVLRILLVFCTLASFLTVTLGCTIGSITIHDGGDKCDGHIWRWVLVSVLDLLTEFMLLALFCSIVWSLQMRMKLKITLFCLQGLRFLCPGFTAVYTASLWHILTTPTPSIWIINSLVWQQSGICYSLISVIVIALIPFLKSFHTGMGINVRHLASTSGSRTLSRGGDAMFHPSNSQMKPNRLVSAAKSDKRSVMRSANETAAVACDEDVECGNQERWSWCSQYRVSSTSKIEADLGEGSISGEMVIQKTVDWSVLHEDSTTYSEKGSKSE